MGTERDLNTVKILHFIVSFHNPKTDNMIICIAKPKFWIKSEIDAQNKEFLTLNLACTCKSTNDIKYLAKH